MSQGRVKRLSKKRVGISYECCDLKSALHQLLAPMLSQVRALNETVAALVQSLNRKECSTTEQKTAFSDFTVASISADVSMIATDTHRLSKCYDILKEQVNENNSNLLKLHEKVNDVEKLMGAVAKRQTKRKNAVDPKMTDLIQNFEEYMFHKSVLKGVPTSCSDQDEDHNDQVGLDTAHQQLLALNTESDFPDGSWLGDPNQSKLRVRCSLRDEDLVYINTKCTTPVKMALTLLDYLFPRETLAISNLSGKGKLGKKQLDPLLVYGIKCHLTHYFNITEKEWEKIKLNIDSKCRAAWKKRRLTSEYCIYDEVFPDDSRSKDSLIEIPTSVICKEDFDRPKARVIRTVQGELEVVQGPTDQVLRLHDLHSVQILEGDHILPIMNSDGEDVENGINLSKFAEQNDLEIIAEETDLAATDTVSFVMEPMLEVLPENGQLISDSGGMIEERIWYQSSSNS